MVNSLMSCNLLGKLAARGGLVTDIVAQNQPKNGNDPKFERWILRDAWDGFWYNLPIMLLVIFGMTVFGVISSKIQILMFNNVSSIDDFGRIFMLNAINSAITVVFGGTALSLISYVVHFSALNGVFCWNAFGKEQRPLMITYLKRFCVFVLICTGVVVLEGILFSLLISSLTDVVKDAVFKFMVTGAFFVHICLVIALVLLLTWPVSVLRDTDGSLRRAFARGKKTFWYFVGKNFLVLLAFVPVQLIISAAILPILTNMFIEVAQAGMTELPLGMLIFIGLFGAILFTVYSCAFVVIVSRAFLVGEARLDNERKGETRIDALPVEST